MKKPNGKKVKHYEYKGKNEITCYFRYTRTKEMQLLCLAGHVDKGQTYIPIFNAWTCPFISKRLHPDGQKECKKANEHEREMREVHETHK